MAKVWILLLLSTRTDSKCHSPVLLFRNQVATAEIQAIVYGMNLDIKAINQQF